MTTGVNVRPLPILEMLDDPLGMGISKRGFSLFATPHTYHLDIRFEQGLLLSVPSLHAPSWQLSKKASGWW